MGINLDTFDLIKIKSSFDKNHKFDKLYIPYDRQEAIFGKVVRK